MFAAAQLGAVTVLLSTRQQKPEIAYALNDCGAVLIIHEAGLAERLPDARDVPALKLRIAVDDSGRSAFADTRRSRAAGRPRRGRRGRHRDDPLYVRHHRASQGRDAGALQHHPFRDDLRSLHGADVDGSFDRGGAAGACHRRDRQYHDHGALRRHADHRRGVQGGGLSQGRRARARHPDRDGAGDV